MFVTSKDWLLLAILVLFIATAISWISFARITMSRLETKMKSKTGEDSFEWDGVGIRIVFYAYAIVLPERYALRLERRLIKSSLVRNYSTPIDRMLGCCFLISSNLFVLACLTGWLIWS
jgi:hypothetical protein